MSPQQLQHRCLRLWPLHQVEAETIVDREKEKEERESVCVCERERVSERETGGGENGHGREKTIREQSRNCDVFSFTFG